MNKVTNILTIAANGLAFRPVPLDELETDIKTAVRQATYENFFSTPNKGSCSFQIEVGNSDVRTVVIDPDGIADEGDLVIMLSDNQPEFLSFDADDLQTDVLGVVTHITFPIMDFKPEPGSNVSDGQEFLVVKDIWDSKLRKFLI